MNFSDQLKAFMELKHISKKQLAEDLSLPMSIIYNATRLQGVLSDSNLKRICEKYNVPSYYFSSYNLNNPTEHFYISERICRICDEKKHCSIQSIIPPLYLPYVNVIDIVKKTHLPGIKEISIIMSILGESDLSTFYYGHKDNLIQSHPSEYEMLSNKVCDITAAIAGQDNENDVVKHVLPKITDQLIYKSSFGIKNPGIVGVFDEDTITIDASNLTEKDKKMVIEYARYLAEKNL